MLFSFFIRVHFLYVEKISVKFSQSSEAVVQSRCAEVSVRKGVLRNFAKFTGKHLCQGLFFNKVKGLWHSYIPVNFAKFLRTPFLTEHLRASASECL